jgi:hypothetical protein
MILIPKRMVDLSKVSVRKRPGIEPLKAAIRSKKRPSMELCQEQEVELMDLPLKAESRPLRIKIPIGSEVAVENERGSLRLLLTKPCVVHPRKKGRRGAVCGIPVMGPTDPVGNLWRSGILEISLANVRKLWAPVTLIPGDSYSAVLNLRRRIGRLETIFVNDPFAVGYHGRIHRSVPSKGLGANKNTFVLYAERGRLTLSDATLAQYSLWPLISSTPTFFRLRPNLLN